MAKIALIAGFIAAGALTGGLAWAGFLGFGIGGSAIGAIALGAAVGGTVGKVDEAFTYAGTATHFLGDGDDDEN
jgi:hypothetical protein